MSLKTSPRPPSQPNGDCPSCGGNGKVGMYQDRCTTCDGTGYRPKASDNADSQSIERTPDPSESKHPEATSTQLDDILRRHHHLPTEQDIADTWNSSETDVLDTASAKRLLLAWADTLAKEVRHDEHFKTHCVTCGKYNKIDRPEDEDICQCE